MKILPKTIEGLPRFHLQELTADAAHFFDPRAGASDLLSELVSSSPSVQVLP
jgi:hypothetical protein